MKKFQFTLNKLLDYKGQVLEKEKNDLAALNLSRAEAEDAKLMLEDELKKTQDNFNIKAQQGVSPMEMACFSAYHESLRIRIRDTEREIADLEAAVEKQTGVVTEASKEVKSLEKLEEKQLEDYKFRANKADEQFIEEYVNGASVRASLAEVV